MKLSLAPLYGDLLDSVTKSCRTEVRLCNGHFFFLITAPVPVAAPAGAPLQQSSFAKRAIGAAVKTD
jgi:hypothetical protein